jgi:hypothetical protein
MEEGALLEEELSEDVLNQGAALLARAAKTASARERMLQRRADAVQEAQGPADAALAGMAVFFEEGLLVPEVRRCLERKNARVTDKWHLADIFTVHNPGSVQLKFRWTAALHGCYLLTPNFWFGKHGPIIKYIGAMSKKKPKRRVWVSEGFKTDHPGTWKVLQRILARQPGRKRWHWLDSKDMFLAEKDARRRSGNSTVIALVTGDECNDQEQQS